MIYIQLKEKHSEEYLRLNKKYNTISFLRLLSILVFITLAYLYFQGGNFLLLGGGLISLIIFIFLIRFHEQIKRRKDIQEKLIAVNEDEISYLNGESIPFENGHEFINHNHFCSFDLDFFDKKSLFQNLNRTATFLGKEKLANILLKKLSNSDIRTNQKAVKELAEKIEWRQYFLALARLSEDTKEKHNNLVNWADEQENNLPKALIIVSYLLPLLFLVSFALAVFNPDPLFKNIASALFVCNLLVTFSQLKKIKKEISNSDKILKPIIQYALIIENIENQNFTSEKLSSLKKGLTNESGSAYLSVKKLSAIVSNMHSVQNVMGSIFVNGIFLYHIHILNNLYNWKNEHSKNIKQWLEIIAAFEVLNSLANFSFNNPEFVFPEINENHQIKFQGLGHPLIKSVKRVCNDVYFDNQDFIILTGSNMSGKSTFLRTLGVNMVLAGIGAPVCAAAANLHPLNVIVSMRQSDSLSDGESYFFAEVKRLKQIIGKLENEICFVLLDEILKGTNSDDKQTGTIEVIRKIMSKKAIGCIATHDLEVCQLVHDYKDKLYNKCFEVEIINNDLSFDYRLRDGICKNKSATFLMKKMEIF
ncbi:DNA mismatch repair protein [Flavobacterium sp. H122]|uniref:MutS-related protein n=1 Tax=Flavobacterium sp. H122 TaxID=2529860 RepID=UPI0010AA2D7C|nr:DNA mismatch repair protein [Flavobacterium sp. H122]